MAELLRSAAVFAAAASSPSAAVAALLLPMAMMLVWMYMSMAEMTGWLGKMMSPTINGRTPSIMLARASPTPVLGDNCPALNPADA